MPITLTTPKDTGDLDSNAPSSQYAELKIIRQDIDIKNKCISLTYEYGNTISGDWVPGIERPITIEITNIPETYDDNGNGNNDADNQYNTLVTKLPANTTESIYDHAAKELYQYLIDKGYVVGTIT